MNDRIEERCKEVAKYVISENATVRQAAKKFMVSKSTVHKDIAERLQEIDVELSKKVRKVLDNNKSERHIRGGEATKRKYMKKKDGKEG